jgi:hypothetical protein
MLGKVLGTLRLLNKPIKLERGDGKVRVVLDHAAQTDRPIRDRASAEQAVARMRGELTALLDRHEASRRSMRHLAGVEHALATDGLALFEAFPERILARASQQLDAVLAEPVGEGLAELRSRLLVALTAKEKIEAAAARNAGPSSFLTDDKLQVSEARVSDFMRAVEASDAKE